MEKKYFSRRKFVQGSVVVCGSSIIWLTGKSRIINRYTQAPTEAKIRKPLHDLSNQDPILEAYKEAVFKMKNELPLSSPMNWQNQAAIHNDHCHHRSWFFLPWHRAYIHSFEKICAKLTNFPDFALPYWDWTKSQTFPIQLTGLNNILNHPRLDISTPLNEEFIGEQSMDQTFNLIDFEVFGGGGLNGRIGSGRLEGSAHNYVHRYVGGDMSTGWSPLDPVFWLHHCNVDRIWNKWLNAGNQNPSIGIWLNEKFDQFYDENGKNVEVAVKDLLSTSELGYSYWREDVAGPILNLSSIFESNIDKTISLQKSFSIKNTKRISSSIVPLNESMVFDILKLSNPNNESSNQTIRLSLNGVQLKGSEDFYVRVFLNCDYASVTTPTTDSHFVGSFTFFNSDHNMPSNHRHQEMTSTYLFDILSTIKKIRSELGESFDKLSIQLVAENLFSKEVNFELSLTNTTISIVQRNE